MSFKDFSILSSGGHFVQRSRTVCTILLEGLMSVKLVEPAVSRCGLKIFLFLTLLVINICNT